MSIFDLMFLGCVLASVVYAAWIVTLVLRRRWKQARRHAIRWVAAVAIYFSIVVLVGMTSSRRVSAADGVLRYDDWCLGVEKATFADAIRSEARPEPGKRFVFVTLRVVSSARRVRQAAPNGSLVYLLDRFDNRYDVTERGQLAFEKVFGAQPALSRKLDPASFFLMTRVFEVPREAGELFLAHRHGTGFPGILVIGDGFRKPRVIRLRL
ncbi:MAG: hypothetical protein ACLQM8_25705 [Limisphaerales bacterium]